MEEKVSIIYVSAAIDEDIKNKIIKLNIDKHSPAQNYHYTNITGLAAHVKEVYAISNLDRKYIPKTVKESTNNMKFLYVSKKKNLYIRAIVNIIMSFIKTWVIIRRNKKNGVKTVVFGDALTVSLTFGAFISARLLNTKTASICTDLPKYFFRKNSYQMLLYNKIIKLSSGYVFVIDNMNKVINTKNKPYILMEGQMDTFNKPEDYRLRNNIVLFGGTMSLINGTVELIRAFKLLNDLPYELHLYGQFENEAKSVILTEVENSSNVSYKGIVTYEKMLYLQRNSYMLVSPRLTSHEYTSYSFPIKMLEYLSSGTAVLSTKLPCLSNDYLQCLFLFEDETVESFSRDLRKLLTSDTKIIEQMGQKAYSFIKQHKSIQVQSQNLIEFGLAL